MGGCGFIKLVRLAILCKHITVFVYVCVYMCVCAVTWDNCCLQPKQTTDDYRRGRRNFTDKVQTPESARSSQSSVIALQTPAPWCLVAPEGFEKSSVSSAGTQTHNRWKRILFFQCTPNIQSLSPEKEHFKKLHALGKRDAWYVAALNPVDVSVYWDSQLFVLRV